jgi:hypothetical protein
MENSNNLSKLAYTKPEIPLLYLTNSIKSDPTIDEVLGNGLFFS